MLENWGKVLRHSEFDKEKQSIRILNHSFPVANITHFTLQTEL